MGYCNRVYLFKKTKGYLVLNDIDFRRKTSFILTAQRGGKTTFLKAIGTAQVFFKEGYVPAEYAEMAPVGNLATHF